MHAHTHLVWILVLVLTKISICHSTDSNAQKGTYECKMQRPQELQSNEDNNGHAKRQRSDADGQQHRTIWCWRPGLH